MALDVAMARDERSDSQREPLRLLWLIDSLTMGGAETLAVVFAKAVRDRSIHLTVCARTSIEGNPLEREVRAAGVEVVELGARNLRDAAAFRRLLTVVRERRIEVIHAHLSYAAIWGSVASRMTRVPLVASLHVMPSGRSAAAAERARQRLMSFLLNRCASRVLMVSTAMRNAWSRLIDVTRLEIVHNGVLALDEPEGPAREAGGKLVVTTVAVLRDGKGIDILIDAAREVLQAVPNVEFVIVGDGPMRTQWQQRANGLPIRWEGFRRDVGAFLSRSHLFVLPTLGDAFPTVLLEAMAAGVPVVATNVGGVPEIVNAQTAILVPPGDARELARAIRQALRETAWRDAASATARARFEEHFSADKWAERLESVYLEVRS